jgi:lipopolysaccharide transport system permease protein
LRKGRSVKFGKYFDFALAFRGISAQTIARKVALPTDGRNGYPSRPPECAGASNHTRGAELQQVAAIWRYRHFWLSLVRMDMLTRYRRSVLGVGWSLLYPLAMTGIFFLVFRSLAPAGDENWWRTYVPNTLAGLAVWEFLRNSCVQGCKTFLVHEPYIRQCPLPYGIYPLRVVLSNLTHLLIGLGLIAVLTAAIVPGGLHASVLAVVPTILLAALFAWSIATVLAFATIWFNDVAHIVELAAQGLFFLTPIVYPRQNLHGFAWIADANPVCAFLEILREPLITGTIPSAERYAFCALATLGAFGLASAVILRYEKRLIFRL